MKSRKSLLKKSLVYLILDRAGFRSFTLKKISSLVSTDKIGLIQLRDKLSSKATVLKLAAKLAKHLALTKTLFIINDYVDVAAASLADGVHLGQGDLSLKQARKILGKNKLIGISCHNLAQALKAQKQGADYIGIGPIYATPTKPGCVPQGLEVIRELKGKIRIPYFAIGDIHAGNLKQVTAAGAKRIAVCRAILKADQPDLAAKQLYKILK